MKIISRADAIAQGLKRYYTGKPCKNGHDAERSVSNYTCLKCGVVNKINTREANRDRFCFVEQRSQAKRRGKEWLFTFETWLEFWEHKIDYRDGTQTGLVMGRYYDCGPYSPENCYITTCEDNFKEFNTGNYQYKPKEVIT